MFKAGNRIKIFADAEIGLHIKKNYGILYDSKWFLIIINDFCENICRIC